jgi:alpha-galactosidase
MLPLLLSSLLASSALAVNNGLARTPQMGWNNWNSLGCDVSESLLLETSLKLADSGLRDVGYNYVVLDDCWSDGRDAEGKIIVDSDRFPSGMKAIAKMLHDKGFLYGMYSSAGEMTCARYEGSLDYETQDAQSWASWDVDYLKYDNCYHRGRFGYPEVSFNRYNVMAQALNATGRPMLYSLCNWGEDYVHTWGMSIANSWRMSGDIYDHFTRPDDLCSCTDVTNPHCVAPGSHCSVLSIINKVAAYSDRGQPGGWNDLDMLEVGNGGMTDEEYVAHFSMWAVLKSPLLIGADLRELSAKTLSIFNNPAVVAVNQDPLGRSAHRISRSFDVKKDRYGMGEIQVWSGPLYPADQVVVFLNAADAEMEMSTTLNDIFVSDGPEGSASQTKEKWDVYDLWAHRMDDATADKVLRAGDAAEVLTKAGWYNSTALSYQEGLKRGDERLMGEKIGAIGPQSPELKTKVARHGVKVFRLRSTVGEVKRYALHKQEL